MNAASRISLVLGLGALVALTGCPNPQTYGTPRTTPKGEIQHSVALEGYGLKSQEGGFGPLPTGPTYTMRVGVTDDIDVGVRLANFSTLHVEGKFNLVKSRSFDFAVAPGVQAFYFSLSSSSGSGSSQSSASSSISGAYLHLPLLFGLNISDSVIIVPTVGVIYGVASTKSQSTSTSGSSSSSSSDSVRGSTGIIGRFGLGFDFRVSTGFALHPEFTVMRPFRDGSEGFVYIMGIGLNFGKLPNYGDVK